MISKRKKKYDAYLTSDEWAQTRTDIILIRGDNCERCGKHGHVHVHHLTYENIGCEESEDLIILCARCHMKEHGLIKVKKKKPKKKKITKKRLLNKGKEKAKNRGPRQHEKSSLSCEQCHNTLLAVSGFLFCPHCKKTV